MVRHYAEKQPIQLYCKDFLEPQIRFMYRDQPQITILPLKTDSKGDTLPHPKADVHAEYKRRRNFDSLMYQETNTPFEYRWKKFKILRDPQREVSLFQKLNLKPDHSYILYCNTTSTKTYDLKLPEVKHKVKVEPLTNLIFDWLAVAQFSKEIHTVDTSFFNLVQSFSNMPKIFLHDLKDCPHPSLNYQTSVIKYP